MSLIPRASRKTARHFRATPSRSSGLDNAPASRGGALDDEESDWISVGDASSPVGRVRARAEKGLYRALDSPLLPLWKILLAGYRVSMSTELALLFLPRSGLLSRRDSHAQAHCLIGRAAEVGILNGSGPACDFFVWSRRFGDFFGRRGNILWCVGEIKLCLGEVWMSVDLWIEVCY